MRARQAAQDGSHRIVDVRIRIWVRVLLGAGNSIGGARLAGVAGLPGGAWLAGVAQLAEVTRVGGPGRLKGLARLPEVARTRGPGWLKEVARLEGGGRLAAEYDGDAGTHSAGSWRKGTLFQRLRHE